VTAIIIVGMGTDISSQTILTETQSVTPFCDLEQVT
jgi:hypothetical protein